jgi:hypothetical protein
MAMSGYLVRWKVNPESTTFVSEPLSEQMWAEQGDKAKIQENISKERTSKSYLEQILICTTECKIFEKEHICFRSQQLFGLKNIPFLSRKSLKHIAVAAALSEFQNVAWNSGYNYL